VLLTGRYQAALIRVRACSIARVELLRLTCREPFTSGEWWAQRGRIVNRSLAEYHVRVNLEFPDIEVIYTNIPDKHAPLGARGVGVIGITGAAAGWRMRCSTPRANVFAICRSRWTSCCESTQPSCGRSHYHSAVGWISQAAETVLPFLREG
jgi:hypothetical protein